MASAHASELMDIRLARRLVQVDDCARDLHRPVHVLHDGAGTPLGARCECGEVRWQPIQPSVPDRIEGMCHWVQDRNGIQEWFSHRKWHFADHPDQTGICPYFAMAEVLRGRSDPREVDRG